MLLKLGWTNKLDPYLSSLSLSKYAPTIPPRRAAITNFLKCCLKNNNIEIKKWKIPLNILPIKLKKFLISFDWSVILKIYILEN
mgnify:CR=1 FL=1